MNLHVQFIQSPTDAGIRLLISSYGPDGKNTSTIASMDLTDPNLQERLQDIGRAFHCGTKWGVDRT